MANRNDSAVNGPTKPCTIEDNIQARKSDKSIDESCKGEIRKDLNATVADSSNAKGDNNILNLTSGISAPTTDVDPSELSEFTEIRTKKDKNKKRDAPKIIKKSKLAKEREFVSFGKQTSDKSYNSGSLASDFKHEKTKRCPACSVPQSSNSRHDNDKASNCSSDGALSRNCDNLDAENKVQYVPAPAPPVNIWEKRQSDVPILNEVENSISTPKESDSSIVEKHTVIIAESSQAPPANPPPPPPAKSPTNHFLLNGNAAWSSSSSPDERHIDDSHPLPQASSSRVPLAIMPEASSSSNTTTNKAPPVVRSKSANRLRVSNVQESDLNDDGVWPTLVSVHRAQEALQLHQAEKDNWRKDNRTKNGDDARRHREDDENSPASDKDYDSESGSRDDDSLKENREASSLATQPKPQQEGAQTQKTKNKKNKAKKQNWRRLDIQPPRNDRSLRRGADSSDWRSDASRSFRGRGAGGRGSYSNRGRGRGRGSSPSTGNLAGTQLTSLVGSSIGGSGEGVNITEVNNFMNCCVHGPIQCYYPQQPENLKARIKEQVEYYFCKKNLEGDIFLRRKMDKMGYIPFTLIASFNRIKQLTQDVTAIIEACKSSNDLEVKNEAYVRTMNAPEVWPLLDPVNPAALPEPPAFPPTIPRSITNQIHRSILMNPEVPEFMPRLSSLFAPLRRAGALDHSEKAVTTPLIQTPYPSADPSTLCGPVLRASAEDLHDSYNHPYGIPTPGTTFVPQHDIYGPVSPTAMPHAKISSSSMPVHPSVALTNGEHYWADPSNVVYSVPHSVPQSMPYSVPQSIPHSVPQSIPHSVHQSVPHWFYYPPPQYPSYPC